MEFWLFAFHDMYKNRIYDFGKLKDNVEYVNFIIDIIIVYHSFDVANLFTCSKC